MKSYRIRDWEKHYETAETRKLVNLRWLPIPNKHDGLGFRRIAAQKNACELFTAWILILQVASKGRGPEERGNLLRDQQMLRAEDLAMMTGFPEPIFQRALDFFSSSEQGWLIVYEDELALSPARPAKSPAKAGGPPAVWNGMEGREGNGKNGKTEVASLPFSSQAFAGIWTLFVIHRREIKKRLTPTASKLALDRLHGLGEERAIAALKHTIANGWQGIREPDQPPAPNSGVVGANRLQMPAATAADHAKGFFHGTGFEQPSP